MNKKIAIIIVLSLLVIIVSVFFLMNSKYTFERFVKVTGKSPVTLIDSFASFQNKEDVVGYLKENGLEWKIVEESNSPGNSFRPEFNQLVIRVPTYSHLGITGSLNLVFNNNRLFEAAFYPSNLVEYLKRFKSKFNRNLEVGKKIKMNDNTTVECQEDYQQKIYVRWLDEQIMNEVSEWINRFSIKKQYSLLYWA